jgi:hypothetical protein
VRKGNGSETPPARPGRRTRPGWLDGVACVGAAIGILGAAVTALVFLFLPGLKEPGFVRLPEGAPGGASRESKCCFGWPRWSLSSLA